MNKFDIELKKGNFITSECKYCAKIVWPPSNYCNNCFNYVTWRKVSLYGKIIEWSKKGMNAPTGQPSGVAGLTRPFCGSHPWSTLCHRTSSGISILVTTAIPRCRVRIRRWYCLSLRRFYSISGTARLCGSGGEISAG